MLESYPMQQEEVEEVAFVGGTKKGSEKGYKKGKKEESSPRKKDLGKVKCVGCHQFGHYTS
jgi:hypothetical protein